MSIRFDTLSYVQKRVKPKKWKETVYLWIIIISMSTFIYSKFALSQEH